MVRLVVVSAVSLWLSNTPAGAIAQAKGAGEIAGTSEEFPVPRDVDSGPGYSTAEDVLEALRQRRPQNVVIPPGSLREGGQPRAKTALYPEGWAFVSRFGRPVFQGDRWVFELEGETNEAPIPLLLNATLEGMVRSTAGGATQPLFVVSGEFTVFEGENYLLPRLALRARTPPGDPPPTVGKDEPPGLFSNGRTASDETSAEDVVTALRGQAPEKWTIPADEGYFGHRTSRRLAGTQGLLPDGAPVVDRPGRVVYEGKSWIFIFESDDPDHPELPMKLLQNRNTELMADAARRDNAGLVFIVSGEVSLYNGENYLLPRVVMQRLDSGNLRK
ncbi:MAG: hypothetical protein ACE5HE_07985 [Phycisphaerae bacterium]